MNKSDSQVREVAAGVVGAAVGATAAVILSDPKTRKNISKSVKKTVVKSKEVLEKAKENAELGKKKIEKQIKRAPKKAKTLKGVLQKGVKKKANRLKKMGQTK